MYPGPKITPDEKLDPLQFRLNKDETKVRLRIQISSLCLYQFDLYHTFRNTGGLVFQISHREEKKKKKKTKEKTEVPEFNKYLLSDPFH